MALRELGILVAAKGALQAARDIGKVDSAVGRLSGRAGLVNNLGSALGRAGGRISGLVGSIGPMVGVLGGAGLVGVLTDSINQAANFGVNVSKFTAVTGLATEQSSAMVDVLDKWGVSTDRLLPIFGKMQVNVGKLAGTQKNATKFQEQYGFSLLDNNGNIADANTLLLRSADYFTSNRSAVEKNLVMSKLWGKGWQDLVPILSKGSKFIQEAEADAIHLTAAQQKNIEQFVESRRDFQDAFGDLQVKVGAELMPLFTRGLKSATEWFDQNGDQIASFFKDAAKFAGDAASAAGQIFSGLATAWNGLPGPVKDLLLKGLIAGKVSKFLFDFGPLDLGKAIIGAGGELFKKGGSPANPLFVSDVSGGMGGGVAGKGGSLLAGVIPAAAIIGIGLLIGEGITKAMGGPTAGTGGRGRPIAGTPFVFGQHQGALVREESARQRARNAAQARGGLSPDDRQARNDLARVGLALQRQGERGGRIQTALERAQVANERYANSTAPSIKSMDANMARLRMLQETEGSRSAAWQAQLVAAINRLASIQGRPVMVTATVPVQTVNTSQVRYGRVANRPPGRGPTID